MHPLYSHSGYLYWLPLRGGARKSLYGSRWLPISAPNYHHSAQHRYTHTHRETHTHTNRDSEEGGEGRGPKRGGGGWCHVMRGRDKGQGTHFQQHSIHHFATTIHPTHTTSTPNQMDSQDTWDGAIDRAGGQGVKNDIVTCACRNSVSVCVCVPIAPVMVISRFYKNYKCNQASNHRVTSPTRMRRGGAT